MRKGKLIIGMLVALAMTINLAQPISYATSEVQSACQDVKPNYDELEKLWDNAGSKNQNTYKESFKAARKAHHGYVGCLFDFAEKKIMLSDGAEHSGTMAANTENASNLPLFGKVVDWMSPDQACLSDQEVKKIILASEPVELLNPVLQAHTDYRKFLQDLGNKYGNAGGVLNEDGELVEGITALRLKSLEFDSLTRQRQLEIDSSLLAIDLMFTSLKELRLAFVMHVNFQCTLKYLDDYRRVLGELRDIIQPLPDQLNDASSS